MGKLKTKKGVSKRFKLSKRGKVKFSPGGKSHLATSKKPKKLRALRRRMTIKNKNMAKYLKRTLPYS